MTSIQSCVLGSAHAAISDPASFDRRLLSLLAHFAVYPLQLTARELTVLYLDKYAEAKTRREVGAKLADLLALGLVCTNDGKWSIADKVNADDTTKLLARIERAKTASTRQSWHVMPMPRRLPTLR